MLFGFSATALIPSISTVVAIVLGSNIGTTNTPFLDAMNLKHTAKRTAIANLIFNSIEVLFYLPQANFFKYLVQNLTKLLAWKIAFAHCFSK